MIVVGFILSLRLVALVQPAIDYEAYFTRGTTFAEFLSHVRALADEWRDTSTHAAIDDDTRQRARALTRPRRLLVVADDGCHDSVATLPYVAKLVEAAPGMLSMRIVPSAIGQPIKDAHLTPDGRAATPTIVILDERGGVAGVFIERPAALLRHVEEHGDRLYPNELRDLRRRWYAEDQGRHAVAEILDLLER